jgi:hypothetical protein
MKENQTVRLYRGARCVRSWSKYQKTVNEWSLCGSKGPLHATEDPGQVDCLHCHELMTLSSANRVALDLYRFRLIQAADTSA